jgi:CRISPR-associated protein Cmr6
MENKMGIKVCKEPKEVVFRDAVGEKLNYNTYVSLIDYLEKNELREINKALIINKFNNITHKDKEYYYYSKEEINILNNISNDIKKIRSSLQENYNWIDFKGIVENNLVIGLGNPSVFETDITLHNTYGIPYIPGSAIKGVLRNYIIEKYFKECSDNCNVKCNKQCEKEAEADQAFNAIFGGQDKEGKNIQGKVIFIDAFPKEKYEIKLDVMTPHHMNYYNDNKDFPLDCDDTNPIMFLVVANGTEFKFNIAVNKDINKNMCNIAKGSRLLNEECDIEKFILENLIKALTFHGIGAKTSVGYGYFEIDEKAEATKLINEQEKRKKEEELKLKKELEEAERIKEEEKLRKALEGKSELEIEIYKLDQIREKPEQYNKVISFYNEKINNLSHSDKIVLARYVMNCLGSNNRWKYKPSKNGKQDKNSKKVEEICRILSVKLPIG